MTIMDKLMVLHNLYLGFFIGIICLGFIKWFLIDEKPLSASVTEMLLATLLGGGIVLTGWHFFF